MVIGVGSRQERSPAPARTPNRNRDPPSVSMTEKQGHGRSRPPALNRREGGRAIGLVAHPNPRRLSDPAAL